MRRGAGNPLSLRKGFETCKNSKPGRMPSNLGVIGFWFRLAPAVLKSAPSRYAVVTGLFGWVV